MAIVNFSQTANMSSPYAWQQAFVTSATGTGISLTENSGFSANFFGSFLCGDGYLAGGTVTGYDIYNNGALDYTIRGANLDAISVNNSIAFRDPIGLQQYTLSGSDLVTGTAGADDLLGWGGNDTINGGSGNDILDGKNKEMIYGKCYF